MGVRFRKTVSLGKGARINFSKSGPSLSLGPRGASIGIGKRGTYANIGIPGTGFSVRTKIGGSSRGSRSKAVSRQSSSVASSVSSEKRRALEEIRSHADFRGNLPLKAGVNEAGEIFFLFTDTNQVIKDKAIIRELKKMPEVKEGMIELQERQRRIWKELQATSEEASREFIDIYKMTPKVVTALTFSGRLNKLVLRTYERTIFPKAEPSQQEIDDALEVEAAQNVTGIFGRKKKIEEYADEHRSAFSEAYIAAWRREKWAFDRGQDELEARENRRLVEEYEQAKASYEKALSNDDEVISELVEDWLSDLTIPADVSAQMDCQNGRVRLDLDLPEIEDLPSTTTKQLKSGQVKVVDKTQKQLKQEYATCVLGLAFFIAGNVFNLNANISLIEISGYTQRRNRAGDLVDEYLYSVRFPREQFRKNSVTNPLDDFNKYENRMKLSSSFTFSKITPYGVSDEETM